MQNITERTFEKRGRKCKQKQIPETDQITMAYNEGIQYGIFYIHRTN